MPTQPPGAAAGERLLTALPFTKPAERGSRRAARARARCTGNRREPVEARRHTIVADDGEA